MAVEAERYCGYRKVGGLYLCGSGPVLSCDRLPYELYICPACGEGVKFSRGWRGLNWLKYAGEHLETENRLCGCSSVCPICHPMQDNQPYGLLFVGESYYTPESFMQEALTMGVSRRIPAIPRNLKLGKTLVMFAHIAALGQRRSEDPPFELQDVPGVFFVFRPTSLEMLIWQSEATPEALTNLEKKKITPIIIPGGDVDHDPRTSLKPKEEEKNKLLFDNLRATLKSTKTGG